MPRKASAPSYSEVGKSLPQADAWEKVLGQAKYGLDMHLPGTLVAKILRSPYPHARIVKLDATKAQRLPGVRAVLCGQDIPEVRFGNWIQDRTILAREKVRYVGEPVAAVAAEDEVVAEEALELISVEYEELPAVFDSLKAMEPDAPLIHEALEAYTIDSLTVGPPHHNSHGNILDQVQFRRGDVERTWGQADIICEDQYSTQPVYQGIIQPHETVAAVDALGKVTVWTTTKAPFVVRRMLAWALGMPMSRLRVIATAMGGDFGARGTAIIEPICVLLAQKSQRPVGMALTREEEFTGTFYREATKTYLKVGARRDGTLIALEGRIIYDTGAYSDVLGTLFGGVGNLVNLYRIPNLAVEGYVVYTNNVTRGQCRAPRTPQPLFALESHLDMVAHRLGMDPIDIRLKNCVEEGDTLAAGEILHNVGLKETINRVAKYLKQQKGRREPNRGWGVACAERGTFPVIYGELGSDAFVKINEDGTVVVLTGVADQGAGQYGVVAQIAAEVLGIPSDRVSVVAADTDLTPYEYATGGSLTTHRVGTTVRLAAEDTKSQLIALAAQKVGVKEDQLEVGKGQVYVRDAPEVAVSFSDLAVWSLATRGGSILGTGARLREARLAALQKAKDVVDFPQYGTHAVQVEIDKETGQIRVLRYLAAHDIGFAINPASVEGQIQGGVAFGLGYALSEEILSERGQVLNPSFSDYHMPTAVDAPNIASILVEKPSDFGPFGAKGVGESPVVAVAPAVANAVYDAIGVRIRDLPITPEKIVRELRKKSPT